MSSSNNLLEDAQVITEKRGGEYGKVRPAAESFAQIAKGMTGLEIRPEHFPLIMQALKFSRIRFCYAHWDEDSWTDVAGWARVAELLHQQPPSGEHPDHPARFTFGSDCLWDGERTVKTGSAEWRDGEWRYNVVELPDGRLAEAAESDLQPLPPDQLERAYEVAPGLNLTRASIEALHFHYTKNGIPETQTAAVHLAATLKKWLEEHDA